MAIIYLAASIIVDIIANDIEAKHYVASFIAINDLGVSAVYDFDEVLTLKRLILNKVFSGVD